MAFFTDDTGLSFKVFKKHAEGMKKITETLEKNKAAVNENNLLLVFLGNLNYIQITSTEGAGHHGHHWCSRVTIRFINHVCEDIRN